MKVRMTVVLAILISCFALHAEDAQEVPVVEGQGPPPAKPGEAWCLVRKPATYKMVTEQVQVAPAGVMMSVVPAKWETKTEQIEVQPEYKVGTIVPAKMKTETVKHMIRPERVEYEIVPAEYKWEDEVVTVRNEYEEVTVNQPILSKQNQAIETTPAHQYWKEFGGNSVELKCFCRCEAPAKFTTICKTVVEKEAVTAKTVRPAITRTVKVMKLVREAQVNKKVVPAEYETITREVVDAPATVTYASVPAKFETIEKHVLAAPEQMTKSDMPAKMETITNRVLDQPERLVWRRRSCDCGEVVKKYKEIPGTDEASLMMFAK